MKIQMFRLLDQGNASRFELSEDEKMNDSEETTNKIVKCELILRLDIGIHSAEP